jgi:predicted nucleic-acid-binding protein
LRAQSRNERFLINRIVSCELVWTLRGSYRFDRNQIADAIGCTRTATFDRRAAELDEFELIPA